MLGGMRANNVSLTRANTSLGEEEPKAWATALSMLEVASATKAAGIPLPVASPTTIPTRPSSRAVCTTVDRLRYSLYESLFDGSKGKGACRCRPRHSQKRDSPHARSLRAHRKALSQIEKGDGIGGTEASSQTPFLHRPERPTQKGLVEPARRT